MDKSLTTKIISAILAVFLLITVISQFFVRSEHTVKTEVAMRYESEDNIDFTGVFVRDEHTVSYNVNGVLEYAHSDGSKLAKNSVIANVYSTASDVEICRKIDNLERRIETLQDAQGLAGTDNSQIEAFNKLIAEKHSELIKAIDDGDYASVGTIKYQLLNLQSKRDMAKGKTVDYTSVINSLNAQIKTLQGKISSEPQSIEAGEAGYFVSSVDGYETELSFDSADELTPEVIEEIVKNPVKSSGDSGTIGKMVESYKWKVAAVLNTAQSAAVTENTKIELAAGSSTVPITATVESVIKYGDDKNVVIFSGDELNSSLVASRTERFKLILDSYNGIRISASAIHFDEENIMGVFVRNGTRAEFKLIKKIYFGDGYVIVEDTSGSTGYLSLYDNIIVEGKDLYDGKIL